MSTTTLHQINRSNAERIAAEAHHVYELRKGVSVPHSDVPARPLGEMFGSGSRGGSGTPVRTTRSHSDLRPTSAALDRYIARADALVRPSGDIEPGAEAAALALLCSMVAVRRTSGTPLR